MKRALKWLVAGWLLAAVGNIPYVYFSPGGPSYIAFVRVYVDFINATALDVTFFAFGLLAAKEKRGRLELEQAHAELAGTHADLLAAQMQLSDKVRASERMRIARQLHDAIDHHLSEQNLHLESALREADAASLPSITTARDLSVNLLKEIRQVVDTGMADNSINLRQALETLCSGIPSPQIALSFEEGLDVKAPSLANAIFRCVQEAVSNTIRHARATTLRVSLARRNEGIAIEIIDDGVGATMSDEGSGLAGIRERAEALGGRIAKSNRPEGGFELDIWLPFAEGAQ
jgi:signal transduction histidine kinase